MSAPDQLPAPPPDDKDWTWVVGERCPECGFDATAIAREAVGQLLRETATEWQRILRGDSRALRRRPTPTTWSPLEYACHVRDVCRIYLERLDLMLTVDGPHYANWDQDATAIADRYHLADPAEVSAELVSVAGALADRFDTVTGDQWDRTGYRSDGATFTVDSFARYFIHDPVHHLYDVG